MRVRIVLGFALGNWPHPGAYMRLSSSLSQGVQATNGLWRAQHQLFEEMLEKIEFALT
jgi:hypothetical protein